MLYWTSLLDNINWTLINYTNLFFPIVKYNMIYVKRARFGSNNAIPAIPVQTHQLWFVSPYKNVQCGHSCRKLIIKRVMRQDWSTALTCLNIFKASVVMMVHRMKPAFKCRRRKFLKVEFPCSVLVPWLVVWS